MKDYEHYDGLGLADLVKTRAVTAKELLTAAVARIEARNPAVNAVVNRMYDRAEATIAAGLSAGPFAGVPYLLKDLGVYYTGSVRPKPTRAHTPLGPDLGEGWSGMGVGHAVTRSVRDSAALLDATAGPDVGDPYWAPPPGGPYLAEVGVDPGRLRIAFTTKAWSGHPVDVECVAAVLASAKLCESLGHSVAEASPFIDEELHNKARRVVIGANTRTTLEARGKALGREPRPDDVETFTWAAAESGRELTASDYAGAIRVLHQIGRVVGRFFTRYDVLLTPTMCEPPYKLGVLSMSGNAPQTYLQALLGTIAFTSLFNTAGNPAMSVPLHWSASGLPVGVQFAAPFGDEATLLRLGSQLEAARPWVDRRPPRH